MALINTQPVRVDDLDKTPDATQHVIVIDGEECASTSATSTTSCSAPPSTRTFPPA
jgi:hypothetical protein